MTMTSEQYIKTVLSRKTTDYDAVLSRLENKAVQGELIGLVKAMIDIGDKLDLLKKHLMYGKEKELHGLTETSKIETNDKQKYVDIIHSIIGSMTEAPERGAILLQMLKDPNDIDMVNFIEEIGDSSWYDGLGIHAAGTTFEKVWEVNDAKLHYRFKGEKFDSKEVLNRNTDVEKKIMDEAIAANPPESPAKRSFVVTGEKGSEAIFADIPDSSQIKKLEYKSNIMTVYFTDKKGNLTPYEYHNVPSEVFFDVFCASSMGSVFAKLIKPFPDKYPFTKKA